MKVTFLVKFKRFLLIWAQNRLITSPELRERSIWIMVCGKQWVFLKTTYNVDEHRPNYNTLANTTGYAGLMSMRCVFIVTYVRLMVLVVLGWSGMKNRNLKMAYFKGQPSYVRTRSTMTRNTMTSWQHCISLTLFSCVCIPKENIRTLLISEFGFLEKSWYVLFALHCRNFYWQKTSHYNFLLTILENFKAVN